jgi:hypothetical protein
MRWQQNLPLADRLRATEEQIIVHEATTVFIGQPATSERYEIAVNRDGPEAATLIEALLAFVEHSPGCRANDLDPLDHTPCTCGLRRLYNPWGRKDPVVEDRTAGDKPAGQITDAQVTGR